jgi:hypothetical protein
LVRAAAVEITVGIYIRTVGIFVSQAAVLSPGSVLARYLWGQSRVIFNVAQEAR